MKPRILFNNWSVSVHGHVMVTDPRGCCTRADTIELDHGNRCEYIGCDYRLEYMDLDIVDILQRE